MYVVDRDFGFAPNPFHGVCTLATCKPRIRGVAKVGDWVVGVGGSALKATGRCIYFMQITGSLTFNEYWLHADFQSKRPARNGSRVASYHGRAGATTFVDLQQNDFPLDQPLAGERVEASLLALAGRVGVLLSHWSNGQIRDNGDRLSADLVEIFHSLLVAADDAQVSLPACRTILIVGMLSGFRGTK